ncbi:cytochrome P450 [Marasmius fiardii PR-910]|nr:cytochrome P450 [Marasmius fiardii PR-910]
MITLTKVNLVVTALSLVILCSVYFIKHRSELKHIRGPPSPSYLLGFEHKLRAERVDKTLFEWSKRYGTAYRVPGCFGVNILVVSDPRAIHRILQDSLNHYPQAVEYRRLIESGFGRGVLWARGEDHKRHRRVLSPAFSTNHMRQFLPLFQARVSHLSKKWNYILHGGTQVINVVPWLQKVTLDIIGESAFDYHFDALDNKPNELMKSLHELELLGLGFTPMMTLAQAISRYTPDAVASWQAKHFPIHAVKLAKRYQEESYKEAKQALSDNDQPPIGKGTERDILSVLVRANRAEDPRKRLSEGEMLAQMSTIIQAGHHTTGYSLAWILYGLAAHPEDQRKVYEEVKYVRDRKSGEFTSSDYDSMNHLTAVLKEALRLHPVVTTLEREASKNDLLPLEFPIVTKDGRTINSVPISNGQRIKVDVSSYNRLEGIWGEDANSWNPKRFGATDPSAKTQIGLFANILTFSAGMKGCIGWRFALMELQAVVTGLLVNYEFSIPPGVAIEAENPGPSIIVGPFVKGKEKDGAQLPLKVTRRAVNKVR